MKYILFIIAVLGIKYSSAQTSLDLKEHIINGVEEFKSENYEEASMSFSEGNSLFKLSCDRVSNQRGIGFRFFNFFNIKRYIFI